MDLETGSEEQTDLAKDEVDESEDKYTLTLQYPIEVGKRTITELKFARIKGKHLRGLPPVQHNAVSFDFLLGLLKNLTRQPPSVIDELQGDDLMEAIERTGDFFDDSPLTTSISSAI
jgi:hypothetical protein